MQVLGKILVQDLVLGRIQVNTQVLELVWVLGMVKVQVLGKK